MWQRMEEAKGLELVRGEVRERGVFEGREGLVFGYEYGDSFFSVVGLVLKGFNDFGRFEVA